MNPIKKGDVVYHEKFGKVEVMDVTEDWCIFEYKYRSPRNFEYQSSIRAAKWDEIYMSLSQLTKEFCKLQDSLEELKRGLRR